MDCSPPGSSGRGISRQEYWSGLPFPPPGDLPNLGMEPAPPRSPELQAAPLLQSHQGTPKPLKISCLRQSQNSKCWHFKRYAGDGLHTNQRFHFSVSGTRFLKGLQRQWKAGFLVLVLLLFFTVNFCKILLFWTSDFFLYKEWSLRCLPGTSQDLCGKIESILVFV